MSMSQWAVRSVAGAAMVLASFAFGTAHAATGAFTGVSSTTSELAVNPGLNMASTLATDLVINAAGVASFDGAGAAGNTVLTFNVTPGALVDGIAYNLSLATVGASWLSEATIAFLNSNGDGVVLNAGFADENSGTGTYAESVLLSDFGLSFNVGADGLLIVEFYETFDDVTGAIDANWTAGSITLAGVVPEPGTYGLMALGLLAVAGAARRRAAR